MVLFPRAELCRHFGLPFLRGEILKDTLNSVGGDAHIKWMVPDYDNICQRPPCRTDRLRHSIRYTIMILM